MGNCGYKTPLSGVFMVDAFCDNIRERAKEGFPAGFNQQQPLLSIVPTQCISCNSNWIPLEVWIASVSAIIFPKGSMIHGTGITYLHWSHKSQLNVARYTDIPCMDGHVCGENPGDVLLILFCCKFGTPGLEVCSGYWEFVGHLSNEPKPWLFGVYTVCRGLYSPSCIYNIYYVYIYGLL